MRTSFHHQSEAQHPKSSAIHKYAGRLPHLMTQSRPDPFVDSSEARTSSSNVIFFIVLSL